MPVNLLQDQPKTVVIVASGNGVPSGENASLSLETIVDEVIQSGKMCKDEYDVQNVIISGLLPRRSIHYQLRRHSINKLLKDQCRAHGFTFMENTNIILSEHISDDGVHLNSVGSTRLCKNLLYYLNRID